MFFCMKLNWKALFITLITTGVFFGLILAMQFFVSDWSLLAPATCWPNCFNETAHDGFICQPWNVFSSLAYSAVGIYILCLPYRKANKPTLDINSNKLVRSTLSVSIIITGLGSVFLHMSLSFVGQTFDVMGMHLISIFIILYAFRGNKISPGKFLALYLLGGLLLLIILILLPDLRRFLFALLIIIGLVTEYCRNHKKYRPSILLAAVGSLAAGFIFWILDGAGLFFNPDSWFQGHVLWHIFGAVACGLLCAYYSNINSDNSSKIERKATPAE